MNVAAKQAAEIMQDWGKARATLFSSQKQKKKNTTIVCETHEHRAKKTKKKKCHITPQVGVPCEWYVICIVGGK